MRAVVTSITQVDKAAVIAKSSVRVQRGALWAVGGCRERRGRAHSRATRTVAVSAGGGMGCGEDRKQYMRAVTCSCVSCAGP
ncbi:hypothetical protein B296_00047096 [Ensete ventricosum]|uniref:Uncharacterized protein n=1 Tax=Ensete ventricosum TaxID=4639 RepID=A0A426Y9M6_ENSVE|nr:hypothetical protein B296_00047096 [Ensete ventricosum]